MKENLSIFGSTSFIGSNFIKLNKSLNNYISIKRDSRAPESKKILYFISTVDNYNVNNDLKIDIDTNLKI